MEEVEKIEYKIEKKIAKFIGAKITKAKDINAFKWESENFAPLHGKFCFRNSLQFKSSWKWLMYVVEFIEENSEWELNMTSTDSHWMNSDGECLNNEERYYEGPRKQNVYEAVVTYIDWFNKQKK